MLLPQLDMLTLDMFAAQTRDLYHIETDRKGGYIEFCRQAKYIEPLCGISTNAYKKEAVFTASFFCTNSDLAHCRGNEKLKIKNEKLWYFLRSMIEIVGFAHTIIINY